MKDGNVIFHSRNWLPDSTLLCKKSHYTGQVTTFACELFFLITSQKQKINSH